MIQAWS